MLPLAIDLGSARVRVVAISRSADATLRLRGIGTAELVAGSDPGEALREAVREAAVSERRCLMMVRPTEAPLRWIRFPKMPGRERLHAAAYEGKAALGAVDAFVVRSRPAGDGRTVLGAVSQAAIDRLTGAARTAGLRIAAIDHQALILADAEESAVLDIGAHHTTLALSRDGVPLVRVLPRGGADFTDAIAREFGIDETRAEHRKQTVGLAGAATDVVRSFMSALEAELRDLRHSEGAQIRELRICGNGSRLLGLSEAIAQDLGIPVDTVRLGRLLRTDLPPSVERSGALDWFSAAALAASRAQR